MGARSFAPALRRCPGEMLRSQGLPQLAGRDTPQPMDVAEGQLL
jgi:hypothetical protein